MADLLLGQVLSFTADPFDEGEAPPPRKPMARCWSTAGRIRAGGPRR
jgi:hypothetical protein